MRGQSVLEFVTTYSWAVLMITVFVLVVLIFNGGSGAQYQYIPSSCSIQPALPCEDTLLSTGQGAQPIQYFVDFINNLQTPIFFPANALNVTMTNIGTQGTFNYIGNCTPAFALPGARIVCNESIAGSFLPNVGSKINTIFTLSYQICNNNAQSSCYGNVYKSTGFATQTVAPASVSYYRVKFSIRDYTGTVYQGANGVIFLNGIGYADTTNTFLLNLGNYIIYAQPPSGYSFVSFNVIVPSTAGSTSPANAITLLRLKQKTTINATFTSAQCNVCYPTAGLGGVPICPAACSNSHSVTCSSGAGTICQTT